MVKKIIFKLFKDPIGLLKAILFRIRIFYKWFYAFYIKKDFGTIERTRWYKDKGDDNLRLNYNLNKNSIIFDIGGYLGDFTEKISKKFDSKIYLFEPNLEFYEKCLNKFRNNKNIICFDFGLGNISGEFSLSDNNEASSTVRILEKDKTKKIKIKKISDVIEELKINKIDLMKINIEGGEYDLLFCLIEKDLISRINNLQIQFHSFVPNAKNNREKIINLLKKTHKNDWSYYFMWENWSLKENE
tara:strand:- start:640 stop:1371 length:732 start_codon:yes stop_codon:yes gene_type:complete